ncbi:MAG: hypothetical protein V8R08_02080 [Coriobacteriales bacterium]
MQNRESFGQLEEAKVLRERLDGEFELFIGKGCDDDILHSFHLDVFMFGLFALDEGWPLGSGIRMNELELLDSIVGESYGMDVYDQVVEMLGFTKWNEFRESIPFPLAKLIECSSSDSLVSNCNDYIRIYMDLAFSLCAALGFNPIGTMDKIRMIVLYCNYELSNRGYNESALPWNNMAS